MKDNLNVPDMQLKYALKKEIEFLLNMRSLCYKNRYDLWHSQCIALIAQKKEFYKLIFKEDYEN